MTPLMRGGGAVPSFRRVPQLEPDDDRMRESDTEGFVWLDQPITPLVMAAGSFADGLGAVLGVPLLLVILWLLWRARHSRRPDWPCDRSQVT